MAASIPVADALFGKTRQAVLALLFGNPGREYYAREIVQIADSGVSQVQRELANLTRSGLVTRRPQANLVYFKANPDAAIYRELVGLVAKSFGIGEVMRKALAPLAAKIDIALIYGSVARGEHHATSDVDVLIVGDVLLSELEGRLHAAEKKLGRTISPTVMDVREYAKRRKANDHFLRAVLASSKIYLIGDITRLKADHEGGAR